MTETTDLAFLGEKTDQLPAFLAENQDSGLGNENVSADDQQIPFLSLLQPLSPQIDSVEGARPGMFHNSITDELYDNVTLVNLYYTKEFVVWRKRAKGGGISGSFETRDAAQTQVEALPGNVDDYDIVETAKHACILVDNETGEFKQPIIIYMKSTNLNGSRLWNSKIQTMNGNQPRFATLWEVSAEKKSNDKGTWFVFKIGKGFWLPTEQMYNDAKAFYESMRAEG